MKRRPLIMIVDDNQGIQRLLCRALELEGYLVAIASDGGEALDLFEKYSPDLIILDIMIPAPDGFQVMGKIRQNSDVPIIILTGRQETEYLHQALVDGADDYIRKPFTVTELIARVRAKLRRTGLVFSIIESAQMFGEIIKFQ